MKVKVTVLCAPDIPGNYVNNPGKYVINLDGDSFDLIRILEYECNDLCIGVFYTIHHGKDVVITPFDFEVIKKVKCLRWFVDEIYKGVQALNTNRVQRMNDEK